MEKKSEKGVDKCGGLRYYFNPVLESSSVCLGLLTRRQVQEWFSFICFPLLGHGGTEGSRRGDLKYKGYGWPFSPDTFRSHLGSRLVRGSTSLKEKH